MFPNAYVNTNSFNSYSEANRYQKLLQEFMDLKYLIDEVELKYRSKNFVESNNNEIESSYNQHEKTILNKKYFIISSFLKSNSIVIDSNISKENLVNVFSNKLVINANKSLKENILENIVLNDREFDTSDIHDKIINSKKTQNNLSDKSIETLYILNNKLEEKVNKNNALNNETDKKVIKEISNKTCINFSFKKQKINEINKKTSKPLKCIDIENEIYENKKSFKNNQILTEYNNKQDKNIDIKNKSNKEIILSKIEENLKKQNLNFYNPTIIKDISIYRNKERLYQHSLQPIPNKNVLLTEINHEREMFAKNNKLLEYVCLKKFKNSQIYDKFQI